MAKGDLLVADVPLIYRRGELTIDYRYSGVGHAYGRAAHGSSQTRSSSNHGMMVEGRTVTGCKIDHAPE